MDITSLFDRTSNELLFYDVYLKDRLTGIFVPIPILINDFVDARAQTPNTGDQNNYRFVRRFFMFDNVAGIEGSNQFINGGAPSVISYKKSSNNIIKLII